MQSRGKWEELRRILVDGDIVLVKKEGVYFNDQFVGRITEVIKSEDGRVRKVRVEMFEDVKKVFLRFIKEFIVVVSVVADDYKF